MRKPRASGFTLIEAIFVIALLGVLGGSVFASFSSSLKAWASYNDWNEVTQNARIAIRRMIREVRYSTSIYSSGSGVLELGTTYLLDSDGGGERVRYQLVGTDLERSVDLSGTGGSYGSASPMAENVTTFTTAYDSGSQTVDVQVVVQKTGKSITLDSTGRMR